MIAAAGRTSLLRLLRRVTGKPVDSAEEQSTPGADPDRPAAVERLGSLFWAACPVCPWEAHDRLIHFDALADAAHHNDVVHVARAAGPAAAAGSEPGQPRPGDVVDA